MVVGEACCISRTRDGAKGRQEVAPTTQHVQVTCNTDSLDNTGFCATTPTADASVATTHIRTPHSEALLLPALRSMIVTPKRAIPPPNKSAGVGRSRRNSPPRSMISRGVMLMIIADVPASKVRSAVLSARLYAQNQRSPATANNPA